jgi:hypothetical protein
VSARRPSNNNIDGRLFADAGTISTQVERDGKKIWMSNPSIIGFTWAYLLLAPDDTEIMRDSGFVLCPISVDGEIWPAKCDLAEFWATAQGLAWLPDGFNVEVLTDSLLTIRRLLGEAPTRTIPPSWVEQSAADRRRLGRLWFTHLNGHPTKQQLADGVGHTGALTSKHNVTVDKMCNLEKIAAWEAFHAEASSNSQGAEAIAPITRAGAGHEEPAYWTYATDGKDAAG